MQRRTKLVLALLFSLPAAWLIHGSLPAESAPSLSKRDRQLQEDVLKLLAEGKQTFRYDTFGDEVFWGDALQRHRAIAGAALGGVGDGVSPATALAVGLKVDMDALPRDLVARLKQGKVDLDDPATTLALLRLNAVVGVTGFFNENGGLRSLGIQCALCHSTVDDSFAPGIGHRLDGFANRDLNVGAIFVAWRPVVHRQGQLCPLPCEPAVDRAGVQRAHASGEQGPLLSRRPLPDAARRGEELR